MSIHLELTREFNEGALRAVICSDQAAVLHRLALASKDGDWILRETPAALGHVLGVLSRRGARYRFGAPLDVRWMAGGWSAHFEFSANDLRVRTDFFTRPPRVTAAELARLWSEQEGRDPPFTDARILAEMKKTDRQKDYPVIGELARLMEAPRDRLLYSRSADDPLELARRHPELIESTSRERPLLGRIGDGRRPLAEALLSEMLDLIEANERRLAVYREASRPWEDAWPAISRSIEALPLLTTHEFIVERATELLPMGVAA